MILSLIKGTSPVDTTTYGVSAAMASSPAWLPWLHSVSEGAALIAPILGVVWLIVQIVSKTSDFLHRKDHK